MAGARLDNSAARRLFLHRHGLADPPSGPGKGADLLGLIERLGFVQLDSINTVARAHDLILFARRPAYRPAHLKRLYEADRALFEHWTHDASVIPMAFYPHWHLRFARDADRLRQRWVDWQQHDFHHRFDVVLAHVRDHGPVSSSDVGTDEARTSGGWWAWHPSKTALEYLWRSGALTVVGREGFQKRYDLTERVIEEHLHPGPGSPAPEETLDWKCSAALDRLGFASAGDLRDFWFKLTPAECKAWVERARARGDVIEVDVAAADGSLRPHFIRPEVLAASATLPPPPNRLRILSPFDPALRDRKRAERLFGFHYRIEVFVPEAKRQYGYYVFPILEGDRLIARIDTRARRAEGTLDVAALWPEAGITFGKGRLARLEAELARLAKFAGCERITYAPRWQRW